MITFQGVASYARSAARPPLLFLYLLQSASLNCSKALAVREVSVRVAVHGDIPAINAVNMATLPENYNNDFWTQHLDLWPELALVAESSSPPEVEDTSQIDEPKFPKTSSGKNVVGYAIGRMDYANPRCARENTKTSKHHKSIPTLISARVATKGMRWSRQGHVTSLAVLPTYRQQGIAAGLMKTLHEKVSS